MVVETSRPTAQVARELGIGEQTLGNWVAIYRREHAGEEPALNLDERAQLEELQRQARELKMEKKFLKNVRRMCVLNAGVWLRSSRPIRGAVQEIEEGPPSSPCKGEAANHRKVRRLRDGVGSVAEKACLDRVRCGS
jgi:transposase